MEFRERFSGSLVGQCLGDALGFPVEGFPAEVCADYVRDVLRGGRAGELGRGPYPFGQYTDDSQLARELLSSLVEYGRLVPEDYAARIAALFGEERIVGRGRATEEAAGRLLRGVRWDEAGTPPPSAGNGSAMRAGPIGLAFYRDSRALIQAAHDQGRITHQDPRCSAGSLAIAGAVALVLGSEGAIEPEAFALRLAEWARELEPSLAAGLERLPGWVGLSPEEAVAEIAPLGQEPDAPGKRWPGISPFVTPSVLWSLYAFLRSPDDYWETVCTAIAVGGDVDTTAAMAGAISGARVGLSGLPRALAEQVNDQGTWGFAELVRLAEAAYRRFGGEPATRA